MSSKPLKGLLDNRRTTWMELGRVFSCSIYFHLHSKIFFRPSYRDDRPPHGSITVLYHHHHHFTCPSEPCISWWPGPPRRKSYEGRNVKIVFPLTFDYRTEIIHYLCIIVFSLCYAPKTTNILCATPTPHLMALCPGLPGSASTRKVNQSGFY